MATRSSSKKIQRVQQAGVNKTSRQRRDMTFPVVIALIIIVGSISVLLARDARINKDGERPVLGKDQWTAAFGTYVCGEYGPIFSDVEGSDAAQLGIHSHNDGLIAIHPTDESVAAENATLGKYFDAVGIEVTDDSWTQPPAAGEEGEPETHEAGDVCGSGDDETDDTMVRLLVWPPQASNKADPEVFDGDFADVRFVESGQTFLLVLMPADDDVNEIDLPPSSNSIDNPAPEPSTAVSEDTGESIPVEGDTVPETIPVPEATTATTSG